MAIQVVTGKPKAPSRFLVIGEPFSGKTTLAAKSPAPLFISTDGNAENAGLSAINVKTVAEIKESLELFITSKEYKTVVIDTIEGVVDIFSNEVLAEFQRMGITAEGGQPLQSLHDLSWGKGTAALNKRISMFAEALAGIPKNVIILSYTKRKIDDITGSIILDSEFKNIRLFTKFMDAQVITTFDGERYKAAIVSKREIMAGQVELGEIKNFLDLIGWELKKQSVKVGKAQKR